MVDQLVHPDGPENQDDPERGSGDFCGYLVVESLRPSWGFESACYYEVGQRKMRAFSITMPTDAAYHRLWDLLQLVPGFFPKDQVIPDRGCELIIGSDSGTLMVGDSNFANVPGMPVALGGCLALQSSVNSVCLKEVYLKGSNLSVSGWWVWI